MLCVGSHMCYSDLAVREAIILPQLTHLSAFKVAFGS